MKQLKNILSVSLSNIIGFGTSFVIGFILPAILTVSDYGLYREFILYSSFSYLLNFGYNDGIYIKYGGKKREEIDYYQLNNEHIFINIFQLIVLVAMIFLSFITRNKNITYFSISVFLISLVTFHQNFLQAIGEFSAYSKAFIIRSVIYILFLIIYIFLFNDNNYETYIWLYLGSFLLLYIIYEYYYKINFYKKINLKFENQFNIFKTGIFILLANMSLTFTGNIGNWIVNIRYSIYDFAQYAFQNSLLNVILLVVNAVGLVFYNYFSKRSDIKLINAVKEVCIYFGIISGLAFFIFKISILYFLPQYSDAISLLSITFIAIPYIMMSKIIFSNIYKIKTTEGKYFKDSILFALFSLILIVTLDIFCKTIKIVALMTTISYMCWYLYCTNISFKHLKPKYKEYLLLISHAIIFYFSANISNVFAGVLIYTLYLILLAIIDRKSLLKTFHVFQF